MLRRTCNTSSKFTVCLLVVAIDASRLTKESAKIKGVLRVTFKNDSQLREAAAVSGASHKTARVPRPLDSTGPRSQHPVCLVALGPIPVDGDCQSPAGRGGSCPTLLSSPRWRQKHPDSGKLGSQVLSGFPYSSVSSVSVHM